MKELELYAAVVVLNDLNQLRVLHLAFALTGKMIIASATVKFLILCMKENSLFRVLTLGLWPEETSLFNCNFSLSRFPPTPPKLGVINSEMAGIQIVHFPHNL